MKQTQNKLLTLGSCALRRKKNDWRGRWIWYWCWDDLSTSEKTTILPRFRKSYSVALKRAIHERITKAMSQWLQSGKGLSRTFSRTRKVPIITNCHYQSYRLRGKLVSRRNSCSTTRQKKYMYASYCYILQAFANGSTLTDIFEVFFTEIKHAASWAFIYTLWRSNWRRQLR